jgi:5-guanidino-2-oxopentanoate decarboxylase
MTASVSCGTRLMALLRSYDIDTVFGMPGVHTLEAYRGIEDAGIRHIGVRHEQGAGFMADGYARVSGKPGVCLIITGPGVTNAATPIGQAFSDSQPMLVISSVAAIKDLGMGRGRLHEITDQAKVTAPLTAFSAIAHNPDQVHELVHRAFALFATERPRPVHISIPLDVFRMPDTLSVERRAAVRAALPHPEAVEDAAKLIAKAQRPVIIAGGGSTRAARELVMLAEKIGAAVIPTIAGKGVIPDDHELAFETTLDNKATQKFLAAADLVIAIGTELSETDIWSEDLLKFGGPLIRIDLDPAVLVRDYAPAIAIQADAKTTITAIDAALKNSGGGKGFRGGNEIAECRAAARSDIRRKLELKHLKVLDSLRRSLPRDGMVFTDMTQIAYTGCNYFRAYQPKTWFFPAGYGTLGFALPAAIGGQLAAPKRPVVALMGDGGFLFTLQELATAVEQKLPIAIVLWNNDSLAQIRDGMVSRGIPTIGVNQLNPDYIALARAFGCHTVQPDSLAAFEKSLADAFAADRPTLIEMREDAAYLN